MKYIYTNTTDKNQSVLLATKNQDAVGVRFFVPGASIELDYPGLNLYVPNLLSCIVIENFVATSEIEKPIKIKIPPKPKVVEEKLIKPLPKPKTAVKQSAKKIKTKK